MSTLILPPEIITLNLLEYFLLDICVIVYMCIFIKTKLSYIYSFITCFPLTISLVEAFFFCDVEQLYITILMVA